MAQTTSSIRHAVWTYDSLGNPGLLDHYRGCTYHPTNEVLRDMTGSPNAVAPGEWPAAQGLHEMFRGSWLRLDPLNKQQPHFGTQPRFLAGGDTMTQFKKGDRVRMAQYHGTVTEAGGEVTYVSWDGGCTRKEFSMNLTLLEQPAPSSGGITGQRPVITSLRSVNQNRSTIRTPRNSR